MDRKKITIILIRLLLALCIYSQLLFQLNAQDTTKHHFRQQIKLPVQLLQEDIDSILDNPDFANAIFGVSVFSLETGEFLYRKNDSKNFIPASTLKLLTTAAALEYLGPDFYYSTNLYLDGKIESNNEFIGNIIFRGAGDPTFSPYFLENPLKVIDFFIDSLDSLGIKSIKGNLIADNRYFDKNYYGSGWAIEDVLYPYSAQIDALSFNDNKIDIIIKPSKKPYTLSSISTIPQTNYVKIVNNILTDLKGESIIYPRREFASNNIELFGSIQFDSLFKFQKKISVSINNPANFFLSFIKQSLEDRNIRFKGALLNIDDIYPNFSYNQLKPLCSYKSPPLSKIISVINTHSHNLAAEMLLKTIGKEITGIGSTESGIETIKKFITKIGIPAENINIVDGSGLSRLNLISPRYMIQILNYIYRSKYKDIFIGSLAVPGREGTLQKRMTKSLAEKNVFAKTGTLQSNSSICGYLRNKDNQLLAFTIMIMNFTVPESLAQNLQDLICMRLAAYSNK